MPFADEAEKQGITIVLENMWEADPYLQKDVAIKANHPHLKASFDNGHALVFSDTPAVEWIHELGEHLYHCHLHDNDTKYDHHLAIGEGEENWEDLLQALLTHAPQVVIVLESDSFNENKKNLKVLQDILEAQNLV